MLGVGNKFPDFDLPSCDADNNLGRTRFISSTDESVVDAAEKETCEDKWTVFRSPRLKRFPKEHHALPPYPKRETIWSR